MWPEPMKTSHPVHSPPVSVGSPVVVLEATMGGTPPQAPKQRKPKTVFVPGTHQSLLLYPNSNSYDIGKTGLAAFLHQRRVPGFSSPICPVAKELRPSRVKHILVHCEQYQTARAPLTGSMGVDFRQLLSTEKGAQKLSHWWLQHGVLHQLSLARALEISNEEFYFIMELLSARPIGCHYSLLCN